MVDVSRIRIICAGLGVSICMVLLFTFPLKYLCKFLLSFIFADPKDSYLIAAVIIIISGFVSYIVAKVNQYVLGKGDNINFKEFFYIFTLNVTITTFFFLLGLYLVGLFVSCVGSIILDLLYFYDELKSIVKLEKGAIGYFFFADNQGTTGNNGGNLNADSDTDSERSYPPSNPNGRDPAEDSTTSSTDEAERLNKSLSRLEYEMSILDRKISNIKGFIKRDTILHGKYQVYSKVMSYIPKYGIVLHDVFSEASLDRKGSVLQNEVKLSESRTKFSELRKKRLDVLDRLDQIGEDTN